MVHVSEHRFLVHAGNKGGNFFRRAIGQRLRKVADVLKPLLVLFLPVVAVVHFGREHALELRVKMQVETQLHLSREVPNPPLNPRVLTRNCR